MAHWHRVLPDPLIGVRGAFELYIQCVFPARVTNVRPYPCGAVQHTSFALVEQADGVSGLGDRDRHAAADKTHVGISW